MKRTMMPYLFLIVSVILLVISTTNIQAFLLSFNQANNTVANKNGAPGARFSESLRKIENAVQITLTAKPGQFTGDFDSPFRTIGEAVEVGNGKKKAATVNHPKLYLKGILLKDRPLAILEDDNGTTYIKGVGEKALDQEIYDIRNNCVTLRDRLGMYELKVEEK